MSKSTTTALEIIEEIQAITIPGSSDRFFQTYKGLHGLIGERYLHFLDSGGARTALSLRVHPRSAQGYGPDQTLSALFIEVDAHKRGHRQWSFFSVKVDLTREDWPEKLKNAFVSAYFVLRSRHEANVAANRNRKTAQEAGLDYAHRLTTLLGERVYDFRLKRGDGGFPVGLGLEITVTGTPEQVAEKIRKIRAITA